MRFNKGMQVVSQSKSRRILIQFVLE